MRKVELIHVRDKDSYGDLAEWSRSFAHIRRLSVSRPSILHLFIST
jgi:hypothetical protein